MYLLRPTSTSVRKRSARSCRRRLLTPSQATMRSASATSDRRWTSCWEPEIDSEVGRTLGQDVEQAAAADAEPGPDANVCSLASDAHHLARPCDSTPVYLASARWIVL